MFVTVIIFLYFNFLWFTENDITVENVTDITDDHLKELKVSIGQRIIFKNEIKLYKEKKETEKKEKENQNILNMDVVRFIINNCVKNMVSNP